MYVEAWQALIDMKKQGLIRSIGVCNFLPEHIKRLENETGITPSINQIELHPYFNQKQQRKWNREHNVVTQSWSPLGRANTVIQNKNIQHIADKHNKTIPQIILRWQYQLNAIALPKSSSPRRQRENINIFDFSLNHNEINKISSLTLTDGRINDQDPATYEEF